MVEYCVWLKVNLRSLEYMVQQFYTQSTMCVTLQLFSLSSIFIGHFSVGTITFIKGQAARKSKKTPMLLHTPAGCGNKCQCVRKSFQML